MVIPFKRYYSSFSRYHIVKYLLLTKYDSQDNYGYPFALPQIFGWCGKVFEATFRYIRNVYIHTYVMPYIRQALVESIAAAAYMPASVLDIKREYAEVKHDYPTQLIETHTTHPVEEYRDLDYYIIELIRAVDDMGFVSFREVNEIEDAFTASDQGQDFSAYEHEYDKRRNNK